jgi:hypothetical protein
MLLAFSPEYDDDNLIFGASGTSILATDDRGATWQHIMILSQTVQGDDCEAPAGCAVCRNSGWNTTSDNAEADTKAYCIECAAGMKRVPYDGSCASQEDGGAEAKVEAQFLAKKRTPGQQAELMPAEMEM